ncbi:MAG: Nudix family hydrolase [Betaproteobacteria bacterium]|nr:Nudix family hydrolase [Betaproteobacteria bacterium]
MKRAACGILRRTDGAVFMQQRRAPQTFAGYWEFPGGKINPGETAAEAVRRELMEETGIAARRLRHFVRRRHCYKIGGELLLDFFCAEYEGAPHGREGQNCMWAAADNLPAPLLDANKIVCKWLRLPPICAVSAAEIFGVEKTLPLLEKKLAQKEIHFLQLRDKNLPPAARESFAHKAAALCKQYGALFLINDDEELAAKTAADGVHLSSQKLAACRARPDFTWAGASCHSAEAVRRAAELNFDFAVLSPVCKTLTHVNAPPLGWEKFADIAEAAEIPVYALGGLAAEDLATAHANHATGIGMMRRAWED